MLSAGSRIGGLVIHELVGRGAMGEVYRAEQVNLHRPVAVKRIAGHLADQENIVARFEREARLVATLNSPHIVQVYEFGPYDDSDGDHHLLLVMEWVEGGRSLRQCMTANIGLPWKTVAQIMRQAAQGLHIAHEQDIVHRDIKPDNMLLSPKGEIKIADFGLAYTSDSSALTADGSVIGTPNYLSPEACNGEEISAAGDIYSLGATCFHLLTGCPLYTAPTTIALLRAHCEQEIPNILNYIPDTPELFAQLITDCLQKSPKDRISSAQDICKALDNMAMQGISFDDDLTTLVAIADQNKEPSTLPTAVDANAATNVSANVAKTLGSQVRNASTTAETLISADVTKTDQIAQANDSQSATKETVVPQAAKPKGIGSLIPVLGIIVIIAAVVGFFAFQQDPVSKASDEITKNLNDNQIDIAFSIAGSLITQHPADKRAHEAFKQIIDKEMGIFIEKEQYDQGLDRLKEHQKRYHWLNIDRWRIDVLLAKAATLYTKDAFAAEKIYRDLRKEFPKELRINYAYLDHYGHGKWDRYSGGAATAAVELLEAKEPINELIGQTCIDAYYWARLEGEWTTRVRNLLLEHYKEKIIEASKEKLLNERDTARIHSYNILHATQSISATDELLHFMRNYFQMSSYSDEWNASHTWLLAKSQDAAWKNLKQQIDVNTFSIDNIFNSWGKKQDKAILLISQAFLPEMKEQLVAACKQVDNDNIRYNAYKVLKQAKQLDALDLWAYHKGTLLNFDTRYHTPQDFEEGVAYFQTQLKEGRSAEARKIFNDSIKYIEDYVARAKKNGFKINETNYKANIKFLNDALGNTPSE